MRKREQLSRVSWVELGGRGQQRLCQRAWLKHLEEVALWALRVYRFRSPADPAVAGERVRAQRFVKRFVEILLLGNELKK